jgi:hypothetical protein
MPHAAREVGDHASDETGYRAPKPPGLLVTTAEVASS